MCPARKYSLKDNPIFQQIKPPTPREEESLVEDVPRPEGQILPFGISHSKSDSETDTPVFQSDTPVSETEMPEVSLDRSDMSRDTRVVVSVNTADLTTTKGINTSDSETDTPVFQSDTPVSETDILKLSPQEQLAAYEFRARLTQKHRRVLAALNALRSIDQPIYTVPVGYGTLSRRAGLHENYLRLTVLPRLAMFGLIGVARKSMQGTTYHLYYSEAFIRVVTDDHNTDVLASLPMPPSLEQGLVPTSLPEWVDREQWGDVAPETTQQLIDRTGSEAHAKELLDIIIYNETHGSAERRVRDRRAVLAHYLRTPHAAIWPNDDGFETLAVRHTRQERDHALKEKAMAEEALRARQEAAQARFLAALADTQQQWLKHEAKRRVDTRPDARFLASRYPLYKAEEKEVMREWMDRVDYGESVPHTELDSTS